MGIFNDTIIPLALNGYEMIYYSQLVSKVHSWNNNIVKQSLHQKLLQYCILIKLNKKIYTFADFTRALLTDQFMLFKLVNTLEKGPISFMK